jgi:hypothetical protein
MSDANYEFEDDAVQDQQQSKDPMRAHMRKLEAENKALREQAAGAQAAQRELNFVKAGMDPNDPKYKYFVKGYDGELTPEAIRQAAEEASLIPSQNKEVVAEQQSWNRVAQAARAGETSEPAVDYAQRLNNAKSPDEVMQLLAQARAEAEKY